MSDKKLQNDIKESAHKIWLAGLGALATAEEEGSKLFKNLVEKGETYGDKGKEQFQEMRGKVEEAASKAKDKAGSAFEQVGDRFDEILGGALQRFGVPTREEIATLTKRVEELTKVVEKLNTTKKARS